MNSSPNQAFCLALSYVRHTENPKWIFVRNISIQWIATLTIPYICTRLEIKFKEGKKRQSTAKRNEWSAQKWEQVVICKESSSKIQTLEHDLLYFLYKIYIYIASYKNFLVTSISVLLQFAIYLCYIFGYTTWIPKTKWKSEERQKKMWKKEEAERIHRLMRSGRSFFLNNILHREMLCIKCVQLLSSSWWMSSSSSSCVVWCRFSHRNISFVVFSQKLRFAFSIWLESPKDFFHALTHIQTRIHFDSEYTKKSFPMLQTYLWKERERTRSQCRMKYENAKFLWLEM